MADPIRDGNEGEDGMDGREPNRASPDRADRTPTLQNICWQTQFWIRNRFVHHGTKTFQWMLWRMCCIGTDL